MAQKMVWPLPVTLQSQRNILKKKKAGSGRLNLQYLIKNHSRDLNLALRSMKKIWLTMISLSLLTIYHKPYLLFIKELIVVFLKLIVYVYEFCFIYLFTEKSVDCCWIKVLQIAILLLKMQQVYNYLYFLFSSNLLLLPLNIRKVH